MEHNGGLGRNFVPVVWLTGLPAAGKSTLALRLAEYLRAQGCPVEVLDGDEVRQHFSAGLGFRREDREAHNHRVIYVAGLLSKNGIIVIVPMISPYRDVRQAARAGLPGYFEVHVHCPLEECIRRDPKGLYRRALAGEVKNFTGIDDPYEEPLSPDVMVDTLATPVEECVKAIMEVLRSKLHPPN